MCTNHVRTRIQSFEYLSENNAVAINGKGNAEQNKKKTDSCHNVLRQKNDQQYGNGQNHPHQHGLSGRTESQQKSVFNMSFYAVFELCLERKHIAEIGQQNGCHNAGDNAEKDLQVSFYRKSVYAVRIYDCHSEQPYNAQHKSLFEIASESGEEFPDTPCGKGGVEPASVIIFRKHVAVKFPLQVLHLFQGQGTVVPALQKRP